MKLLKVCASVSGDGCLILPMESVNLEGFRPGNKVSVFLTIPEDGEFSGLMMLAAPSDSTASSFSQALDAIADVQEESADDFSLPHDLLRAAGIPIDCDLDVACAPGVIIIRESGILNRLPDGLRKMFRSPESIPTPSERS